MLHLDLMPTVNHYVTFRYDACSKLLCYIYEVIEEEETFISSQYKIKT